jgi:hypothetical protein
METILASNLNNNINIFPRKNENESNPVGRNLNPFKMKYFCLQPESSTYH